MVLALLAEGHVNKEIAGAIGRSKNVVDKILSNGPSHYAIYPKIGVSNAKGAVAWYLQHTLPTAIPVATPENQRADAIRSVGASGGTVASLYLIVLVTVYFCLLLLTFVPIWLRDAPPTQRDNICANALAIIPALAGAFGLRHATGAGSRLNALERRGWRIFSAGLVAWAVGGVISALYSATTSETAPYPSVADCGFFVQTACQTIAFSLWWREFRRRAAPRAWAWPLLAVPLALGYVAFTYAIHDPRSDPPLQRTLDLFYPLGDSLSIVIALSLILPAHLRPLPPALRRVWRFLAAGMTLMFLSGLAFVITSYLPDNHLLKFSNGNPIDFAFATAFLLMGIAIGLIPREAALTLPKSA